MLRREEDTQLDMLSEGVNKLHEMGITIYDELEDQEECVYSPCSLQLYIHVRA